MLTKSQNNVVEFLKAHGSVLLEEVESQFHGKTIKNLLNQGVIKLEHKSRLRTDDMEMVYWQEVSLVKTGMSSEEIKKTIESSKEEVAKLEYNVQCLNFNADTFDSCFDSDLDSLSEKLTRTMKQLEQVKTWRKAIK